MSPAKRARNSRPPSGSEIEDTAYYRHDFDHDETAVEIEHVREYARAACLCQLRAPDAADGPILRDLFLNEPQETAPARRATLRMLLDIAEQTDGHSVDQAAFRQLLFFGAASNGSSYAAARGRRRNARTMAPVPGEGVLRLRHHGHVRRSLRLGHRSGRRPPPGLARCCSRPRCRRPGLRPPGRLLDVPAPGLDGTAPSANCSTGCWVSPAPAPRHSTSDAASMPRSTRTRCTALGRSSSEPASHIAGGVAMLASLYPSLRPAGAWLSPAWTAISRCGEDGTLSVDRFMRTLRARLRAGSPTIFEIAQWLMNDYVVLQHQLVATSKLPGQHLPLRARGKPPPFPSPLQPARFQQLTLRRPLDDGT